MTVASQAERLGFSEYNVFDGLLVFQRDTEELYVLTNTASYNLNSGWKLIGSGSGGTTDTGSLMTTASAVDNVITFTKGDATTFDITIDTGSSGAEINYVSGSTPYKTIGGIEVLDFDDNVIVDYNQGTQVLKFVFGIPPNPSPTITNTAPLFDDNRFNKVLHTYGVTANFDIGNNTLISASLLEITTGAEKTLQGPVGTGTGFVISETTSGSREYRLVITSSNPATGNVNEQVVDLDLDLDKGLAAIPTIAYTDNVQLGTSGLRIEEGATGTIAFTATTASAGANGWIYIPGTLTTSPPTSPITLIESDTAAKSIFATADYSSSGVAGADNSPALYPGNFPNARRQSSTRTYARIKSLRFGTSLANTTFTLTELQDLAAWDTTLGGNIGTIYKGTTNPNGATISRTWSGDAYQFIIYDAAFGDLTEINDSAGGYPVLDSAFGGAVFATVGGYKIYRTTVPQAGLTGTTQGYNLVI
jgi:hypothetical protein